MKLLAIDPGETSGWVFIDTSTNVVRGGNFKLFDNPNRPWWQDAEELLAQEPDVVVMERFLLYPWARKQLTWDPMRTVEVIGVIKYLADKRCTPYVMQTAAQGKTIKRTKHIANFTKHEYDALRHALVYLRHTKQLTPELAPYIEEWQCPRYSS